MDKALYGIPQKEQGELLTIDGDSIGEEGSMLEIVICMYFLIVCVFQMRNQWLCWRNKYWKIDTCSWMSRMILK